MKNLALLLALALVGACHMSEVAASRDPQRCERDPKCQSKQGRTQDCSRQCNDDPACVDRCEQIQQSTGAGLGH